MNSLTAWMLYGVFALGAMALYLAMPRGERTRGLPGFVIGVAAVIGLMMVLTVRAFVPGTPGPEFIILTTLAILSTARVITHPKPVYSVVYFVVTILSVAGLLVLDGAEFLAAGLVIVYAGAIIVTYVFVIMLAQQSGKTMHDAFAREPLAAVLAGFVLMATISTRASQPLPVAPQVSPPDKPLLSQAWEGDEGGIATLLASGEKHTNIVLSSDAAGSDAAEPPREVGNTEAMGVLVMTKYIVVLQLSALLLLISMVGAVALSRKRVVSDVAAEPEKPLGQAGREVKPY